MFLALSTASSDIAECPCGFFGKGKVLAVTELIDDLKLFYMVGYTLYLLRGADSDVREDPEGIYFDFVLVAFVF